MKFILGGAAAMALAACGAGGELSVRALPTALAAGEQSASYRVAEARGHFALGNFGLALEGFRKAYRDDPRSVDALNGIAACYDRMGRFDLSRRHYEMALAVDPTDARLYANLAYSLELQGKREEAMSVRTEMAQRLAAADALARAAEMPDPVEAETPAAPATAVAAAPPPAAKLVIVALAPPRPAEPPVVKVPAIGRGSVLVTLDPPRPIARPTAPARMAEARSTAALGSPRLLRLSSGEVALVTGKAPALKRIEPVRMATATRGPASAPIVLLNAARKQGLAARTRVYLAGRGWRRIEIGDAPRVHVRSVILYPATRREQARRLAAQFGFALQHGPASGDRLTVLLGRDAAANRFLRTRSA